uniref:RNA-dependent RNA polymerase n=1 Tax=Obscuromonas narnavirus 2 TaxID=3157915 RepID=A0AAU7BNV1_9VIRU
MAPGLKKLFDFAVSGDKQLLETVESWVENEWNRANLHSDHVRFLRHLLRTYAVVLVLCRPPVDLPKQKKGLPRIFVESLLFLTNHVLTRGMVATAKLVKDISHRCREISLGITLSTTSVIDRLFPVVDGIRGFSQIARWARALPPPTNKATEATLDEYVKCLTTHGVTDLLVLQDISNFGEWWGRRHKPGVPFPGDLFVSPSACLTHSVKQGGQLAAWEEIPTHENEPPEMSDESLDRLMGKISEQGDRKGETPTISLSRIAMKNSGVMKSFEERDPSDPIPARASAVRTKGFKTRMVTVHPVDEIIYGQYYRRMAFSALHQFAPVASSMDGDHIASIRRILPAWKKGKVFFSSDLTAATDKVHQDAARALLRGIATAWGVKSPERLFFPHMLDLSNFGRKEKILQVRGILMGSPMTWFTLNLLNFYCYMRALDPALGRFSGCYEEAMSSCSLCGDDLIAACTRSTIDGYKKNLEDIGFELNVPKSFVSDKSGVFTEHAFHVVFKESLEAEPFPSLENPRKLVEVVTAKDIRLLGDVPVSAFVPSEELPLEVTLGPSLTGALDSFEITVKEEVKVCLKRAASLVMPSLVEKLIKLRIDPGAPRALGGAELPWMEPILKETRLAASIMASGNFLSAVLKDPSLLLSVRLASPFSVKYEEPSELALSLVKDSQPPHTLTTIKVLPQNERVPVALAHAGPWVEYFLQELSLTTSSLREMGVLEPRSRQSGRVRSLGRIAVEMKRLRDRLLATYPNAPPSQHPVASLSKAKEILDSLVQGPYHPSQLILRQGVRRGRPYSQYVLAYSDQPHVRQEFLTYSNWPCEYVPTRSAHPLAPVR